MLFIFKTLRNHLRLKTLFLSLLSFSLIYSVKVSAYTLAADADLKKKQSFNGTSFEERKQTLFTFGSDSSRRFILLPALGSFLLPGLDQWVSEQVNPGLLYSGYALAGIYTAGLANTKISNEDIRYIETEDEGLPIDPTYQIKSVATQAYMFAGFMSAYHSFRTYAEVSGDARFDFVKNNEDTIEDLLLSPLKFKFLLRPTTFVPLLLGAALIQAGNEGAFHNVRSSDVGFALGTSYHAGVGEEAFFRGFLYPYLKGSLNSNFWGNFLSSVIFGALHTSSDNPVPVFQTAFGMYDAYVTKKNNWSIQESIFLHFWWDVMVIGLAYSSGDLRDLHHNKTLLHLNF